MEKSLIGFIGLEEEFPGIYINELILDENFRRQGFGKMLMEAGFNYIFKEKKEKMWTTLSIKNSSALNFYLNCGFNPMAYRFYLNLKN